MNLLKIKNFILDLLFPIRCPGCGVILESKSDATTKLICQSCLESVDINSGFFCSVCLKRLPSLKICHPRSYSLAAATSYKDSVIKNALWYFKYQSVKGLKKELGSLMIKYLKTLDIKNLESYILTPMPLHPKKQRQRGFNQADLLAEVIAGVFHLPIVHPLIKTRYTESQTKTKNWEGRKENMKDSFRIIPEANIYGKNILLVDDVFTSGATMNETVSVLKRAGVKKIIGVVLAKG